MQTALVSERIARVNLVVSGDNNKTYLASAQKSLTGLEYLKLYSLRIRVHQIQCLDLISFQEIRNSNHWKRYRTRCFCGEVELRFRFGADKSLSEEDRASINRSILSADR